MDAKEAMEMGKMHAKNKHKKELSDTEARKMMKTGEGKMMKKEMKKEMEHH